MAYKEFERSRLDASSCEFIGKQYNRLFGYLLLVAISEIVGLYDGVSVCDRGEVVEYGELFVHDQIDKSVSLNNV